MTSKAKSSCFAPRTAWLHETTLYTSPSRTPAAATAHTAHESRKYRGAAYNPMDLEDGYVRLDSNGDQEVETELRRLRSSVQQFINPTAPA